MRKNWVGPRSIDPEAAANLAGALGVSRPLARILVTRGKSEVEEARRFLEPRLSSLAPPGRLSDADAAIGRLLRALRAKEKILVFGDFDVDGVTGTALALRTLRAVGAEVEFLLPKRLEHGYGLSMRVLPEVIARRPALLITVDCGIRSVEEVRALSRAGVDVVVTDHHETGAELPPALAVVNPKRAGSSYPDKQLAGCGVMFQLLRGLVGQLEHEVDLAADLDLVALGTVADVVPLDGENRVLVHEGLQVMNRRAKAGVMALALAAGVEKRLEAWHLAYLLGPRINAAGRLGDAAESVRLLVTGETRVANELARRLDAENRRRQEISAATLAQALEAIERGVAGKEPAGIVLASNGWHPGVIGIAAAKLVERFYRPTVLIAMDGAAGRGSVRSIPGVDVCAALEECAELLVQYGGHPMAAGLAIERERVAEFRERFCEAVGRQLDEKNASPTIEIDDEIDPEAIDLTLAEELERLAPFGYGNSRPTFLVRSAVPVGGSRVVGRGHLKMSLRGRAGAPLDCIGFDLGEKARGGLAGGPLDVVGHIAVNEWNEKRIAQLRILDFREALR